MKKRTIFSVLISLILLTCTIFSCTQDNSLGNEAGMWRNRESIPGVDYQFRLEADKNDIDWFCVTDTSRTVLSAGTDYKMYDKDGNEFSGTTIKKGEKITFDFSKSLTKKKDVELYIYQNDVAYEGDTEYPVGSMAARGRINLQSGQGFDIKASNYKEPTPRLAVITINNDETTGNTTWHGTYEVTEIWPLGTNEDDPEITAINGLKYIFTDNPIKPGTSRKIIVTANESTILALKQPNRLNAEERERATNFDENEMKQDWYEDFGKDCETLGEFHDQLWWAQTIAANDIQPETDTYVINTSACNKRFGRFNMTLYEKSVLGSTYIINKSDIVDGSDIK